MKSNLQGIRKKTLTVFVLYILVYYFLLFAMPEMKTILSDILSLAGSLIALVVIKIGMQWQPPEHKKTWFTFGIGVFLYMAGDFLWLVYELVLGREIPFPSLCDVFYLSSPICYCFAIFFLIRKESVYKVIRTSFDILITIVVAITLLWKYILLPIAEKVELTAAEKFVSMAYPILDIGYLGGLLSLYFIFAEGKPFRKSAALLCSALFIWFAADQAYLFMTAYSTYDTGSLMDPLWPVASILLGMASLWPMNGEPGVGGQSQGQRKQLVGEYFRFLLPYAGAALLMVLAGLQYFIEDPLIAGIVVSLMLIMIRQIFSLLENRHLLALIQKTNASLEDSRRTLQEQNDELVKLNYLKECEANTDFLTGLYNRRFVDEELSRFLYRNEQRNSKQQLCVLLIDVDSFKQINDQRGHDAGDRVLKEIAGYIRKNLRAMDIAGRYGGDEFIVILPDADLSLAERIAERLVSGISELLFEENGEVFHATVSIGYSQARGMNAEHIRKTLISRADKALYKAKKGGRNQSVPG